MANNIYQKGEISQWNEGDLKNLRLHKAQEMINIASSFSLSKIDFLDFNAYGYELWFKGIDILFREGYSKYKDNEYKEVLKLKKEIEKLLDNPICLQFKNHIQKGISVNKTLWKNLKPKLEEFEYLVKLYNDKHGLSTRNIVEQAGLF